MSRGKRWYASPKDLRDMHRFMHGQNDRGDIHRVAVVIYTLRVVIYTHQRCVVVVDFLRKSSIQYVIMRYWLCIDNIRVDRYLRTLLPPDACILDPIPPGGVFLNVLLFYK